MWGAGSYEDYTSVTSLSGEPLLAEMLPEKEDEVMAHKPGISAYELWQVHRQKKQLQQEWLDHWNDTVKSTGTGRPIDALICPVGPIPATPHGRDPYVFMSLVPTLYADRSSASCTRPTSTYSTIRRSCFPSPSLTRPSMSRTFGRASSATTTRQSGSGVSGLPVAINTPADLPCRQPRTNPELTDLYPIGSANIGG
jgi:hypothetical protein